jgi:cell division protein FtsB
VTRGRWVALVIVVLALAFALGGGEYGTWNWWVLRRREREEQAAVARLQATVDSLTLVLKAVQGDPQIQERIARERFGMIRRGEFLYKIVPADSDGAGNGER